MASQGEKQQYTVSAVIPAYNVQDFISRAIDSVLAQSRRPNEIIVVDDGSTDNTAELVKSFGDKVRYIYQKNAGPSAARNTGINAASSEWIALLDADDKWLPQKLQLQLDLLKQHDDLVWCSSNYLVRSPKDNQQYLFLDPDKAEKILKGKQLFDSCFEATNLGAGMAPCTMIIKREILKEVGRFQEGLYYLEEFDLWWRIAYRWPKLGYVNQPLAVYSSLRPGSLTVDTTSRKIMENYQAFCERHLNLAAKYGKQNELKPFIIHKLQKWLYVMYCEKQFDILAETITRFDNVLPRGYTAIMRLLIRLPFIKRHRGKQLLRLLRYGPC